jgi:hypothetical protein
MTLMSALYKKPRLLDRSTDVGKKLAPVTDFRIASAMNGMLLTAVEFIDACREYVIAFVTSGEAPSEGGKAEYSPIVMLGLRNDENLFVRADGGWDARYVPAFLRRYPLAYARTQDNQLSVMVDEAYAGFGAADGQLLVEEGGQPAPALQEMIKFLDMFEQESQRTRAMCQQLAALDLLVPRELSGNLPDGQKLAVAGFSVVDEEKLRALPDAKVIELHRNGILGLVQAHLISLGNHQRLFERLTGKATQAA